MNFPTYPGKMKAAQSRVQQTQSLLCLDTGTTCAHQQGEGEAFQPPYPKTASTSATASSINTGYEGKKS